MTIIESEKSQAFFNQLHVDPEGTGRPFEILLLLPNKIWSDYHKYSLSMANIIGCAHLVTQIQSVNSQVQAKKVRCHGVQTPEGGMVLETKEEGEV